VNYLEVEELKVGETYLCHFYDNSPSLVLAYIGGNEFKDENNNTFTLLGDIRYVVNKPLIPMNIQTLKELEKQQNEGRGVSCVRNIIHHLERNKQEDATITALTESDKIRNYPEIEQELEQLLPELKTKYEWRKYSQRS